MTLKTLLRASLLLVLAGIPLQVLAGPKATLTAPHADGPTQVEFSTNPVSKWTDLPMGTYRVPNSDVIISGHQKGGATGLLFGVVGVAVQSAINSQGGKEVMASAEQALTFTIDEEAKAKLEAATADPAFASTFTTAASGDRKFEVTGAVVLSFAGTTEVQPYVVLRVKLLGNNGRSKLWTTRYIASQGARRPLVGEGSWSADDGTVLRSHVSGLLDLAIQTMLKDIATPYPRDEASMITVRGYFPHVNKQLQVVGYKLSEQDGRTLFLPNLGTTIVFAGVNILDSASVSQKPTVKGDAPLKLLKPKDLAVPGQAATATASAVAPAAAQAEAAAEVPAGTDEDAAKEEVEGGAPASKDS